MFNQPQTLPVIIFLSHFIHKHYVIQPGIVKIALVDCVHCEVVIHTLHHEIGNIFLVFSHGRSYIGIKISNQDRTEETRFLSEDYPFPLLQLLKDFGNEFKTPLKLNYLTMKLRKTSNLALTLSFKKRMASSFCACHLSSSCSFLAARSLDKISGAG